MTNERLEYFRSIAQAGARHPKFAGEATAAWLEMIGEIDRLREVVRIETEANRAACIELANLRSRDRTIPDMNAE